MKLPFDKIYCLHLAEDTQRRENVLSEIKKINLENKVNFWYTTKKPINSIIGNSIQTLHTGFYDQVKEKTNPNIYGAVFDCSYNHYSIIKQALLRGIESILIIEDDIVFNNDLNMLKSVVDNIPKDYDVLKLYSTHNPRLFMQLQYTPPEYALIHDTDYFNRLTVENQYEIGKYYKYSTLCYALSKKGMEALVAIYESNYFLPSDLCLDSCYAVKGLEDIKFYALKENIFCEPNQDCVSYITFSNNYQLV